MNADLWMNGKFVSWDKACVHPLSHSMQRGATLFESIDSNRTTDGRTAIFRLHDHLLRLENSAEIIGMKLPYNLEELSDAVTKTVARSGMKKCVIRPLAYYADPVFQVYPGDIPLSVVIGLGTSPPPPEKYRVKISRLHKIDCMSMPMKAKVSGNYIGPMIAKSEAVREGFDDTIILDRSGNIAEGATANIFIVEKGALVTTLDEAILPGITRDSISKIAEFEGIEIRNEKISPERLKAADEAIICSSGIGATPIVEVDNSIIGSGAPGEITMNLRKYYIETITGHRPEFDHWLTYVGA